MKFTRLALLSAVALTCITGIARADIVTSLAATPVAIAGGYAYTYNIQLSGGQLDAVTNGTPVQFGTVYDFGPTFGTITTTGLASQFTWTLSNTNTTASQTNPNDNPAIQNIRFTYIGTSNIAVAGQSTTNTTNVNTIQPGNANLGTFTVDSIYGPTLFATRSYDGQSYKGTNDTIQGNVGFLSAPLLPTDVPEPASLALLGSALFGLGMLRRRA